MRQKKNIIMKIFIICHIYITLSLINRFSSHLNSFSQWTKDVEYNFFRGIYLPRFFIYFIFLTHDDSFPISERYLFNWSMNVFFHRERYLFFLIQYVYLFFERVLNDWEIFLYTEEFWTTTFPLLNNMQELKIR